MASSSIIRGLSGNVPALVAALVIVVLLLTALFGPRLVSHAPDAMDLDSLRLPPGKDHLLGTDSKGRDILSRIVHGARISLAVGVAATPVVSSIVRAWLRASPCSRIFLSRAATSVPSDFCIARARRSVRSLQIKIPTAIPAAAAAHATAIQARVDGALHATTAAGTTPIHPSTVHAIGARVLIPVAYSMRRPSAYSLEGRSRPRRGQVRAICALVSVPLSDPTGTSRGERIHSPETGPPPPRAARAGAPSECRAGGRWSLEARKYFLSDTGNTPWKLDLLLKMGTAGLKTDRPPKMHWHSSTTEEIIYDASDPKRVNIPWVHVKRLDGKVRTYRAKDAASGAPEPKESAKRRMDCVDCHNRAGHAFRHPSDILNALLSTGLVDPLLPDIKATAVKALEGEYKTNSEGKEAIKKTILYFYRTTHPSVAPDRKAILDRSIESLQRSYERNYDPLMKVSWKNFPSNQGHRHTSGCFRCHDGNHGSDDGTVLSNDCTLCHVMLEHEITGERGDKIATIRPLRYPHPVDIGDSYLTMKCSDCHGAAAQ